MTYGDAYDEALRKIAHLEEVNGKLCAEINRQERVIEHQSELIANFGNNPYEVVSCEHVITPDELRQLLADWDAHPGWAATNDETPFFLWGGKLMAEQVREIIERNAKSTVGRHVFSDARYEAIAYELNAALGGECENLIDPWSVHDPFEPDFECSECHASGHANGNIDGGEYLFCPRCGKAVKR